MINVEIRIIDLLVEIQLSYFLDDNDDWWEKGNSVKTICLVNVEFVIGKYFWTQSAHLDK